MMPYCLAALKTPNIAKSFVAHRSFQYLFPLGTRLSVHLLTCEYILMLMLRFGGFDIYINAIPFPYSGNDEMLYIGKLYYRYCSHDVQQQIVIFWKVFDLRVLDWGFGLLVNFDIHCRRATKSMSPVFVANRENLDICSQDCGRYPRPIRHQVMVVFKAAMSSALIGF